MSNPNPIFLFGKDIYVPKQFGEFWGYDKHPVLEVKGVPAIRREGGLIPVALMHQIKAFFMHTYEDYKGEAEIQLFYNSDAGLWAAAPMPQEKRAGMSVTPINDTDKRAAVQRRMMAENGNLIYDMFGTGHHHCNVGAFQSGTDHNDEKDKEGIHFTIGNLLSPEFSTHFRVGVRGVLCNNPRLEDWFECGVSGLCPDVREAQLAWELKQKPPEGTTFPAWWLESLESRPTSSWSPQSRTIQTGGNGSGSQYSLRGDGSVTVVDARDGKRGRRGKVVNHNFGKDSDFWVDLGDLVAMVGGPSNLLMALEQDDLLVQFAIDYQKDADGIASTILNVHREELIAEGWTSEQISAKRSGKISAFDVPLKAEAKQLNDKPATPASIDVDSASEQRMIGGE